MSLNTGIEEGKRTEIAKGLSRLLAETYTLYLKTHKYHWNVVDSFGLDFQWDTGFGGFSREINGGFDVIRVFLVT